MTCDLLIGISHGRKKFTLHAWDVTSIFHRHSFLFLYPRNYYCILHFFPMKYRESMGNVQLDLPQETTVQRSTSGLSIQVSSWDRWSSVQVQLSVKDLLHSGAAANRDQLLYFTRWLFKTSSTASSISSFPQGHRWSTARSSESSPRSFEVIWLVMDSWHPLGFVKLLLTDVFFSYIMKSNYHVKWQINSRSTSLIAYMNECLMYLHVPTPCVISDRVNNVNTQSLFYWLVSRYTADCVHKMWPFPPRWAR